MKSAEIKFGGRTVACLIRNQSVTGAALEVESARDIPSKFKLWMNADRDRYGCTVIWRTEHQIGVKFREASEFVPIQRKKGLRL